VWVGGGCARLCCSVLRCFVVLCSAATRVRMRALQLLMAAFPFWCCVLRGVCLCCCQFDPKVDDALRREFMDELHAMRYGYPSFHPHAMSASLSVWLAIAPFITRHVLLVSHSCALCCP